MWQRPPESSGDIWPWPVTLTALLGVALATPRRFTARPNFRLKDVGDEQRAHAPFIFITSTLCLKKVLTSKLCQILTDFPNFSLMESAWNFLQNLYNNAQLILGMLLHYPGKWKIQIFADSQQIWKKMQTNCILSPPILITLRV